jgi:folate-dependent phosphoribosylglycinamide formyltransferase PurN
MPGPTLPLRIAILTSHSAPGIEFLLDDENRGRLFDIVAVICSGTHLAEAARLERAGVTVIYRPIREFHEDRNLPLHNLNVRSEYDGEIAELLHRVNADFLFLVNYNYLVTEPLLAMYPQRIVALHDGDLTLKDSDGRRLYAGPHAVTDAILGGEPETRSSAFIVTREAAAGPLFLMSGAFPVAPLIRDVRAWGAFDVATEYASIHRRWMLQASWGPMLVKAAELLAAGYVQIVHDVAWVDGAPGPCRMGEAPVACHESASTVERGIPASCPFIAGI